MSIAKPNYNVNVRKTRESTQAPSMFVSIPADSSVQLRFLPPDNPEGVLFFRAVQHFRFKDNDRNRAWACLDVHGENAGGCPGCELVEYFRKNGTEAQKKIANERRANARCYAQVIEKGKEDQGPRLVPLSPTTADQVSDLLEMQFSNSLPLLTDVEAGEWVVVSRKGSGLKTEYKVMPTGVRVPLKAVNKDWEDKFLNIKEKLDLKIATREQFIQSIKDTLAGELPLDEVFGD